MLFKKYPLILQKIAVLAILTIIASCNDTGKIGFVIKRPLDRKIENIGSSEINVQCGDYTDRFERLHEKNAGFVLLEISAAVGAYEASAHNRPTPSKIRVECVYNNGWGFPSFGRHFNIRFRYISKVNLKFVEVESNEVLGEAEYTRSNLGRNPVGFIRKLVYALLAS
jgi:hypothetical protein